MKLSVKKIPDTSRAGRGGTAHGGATGRGGATSRAGRGGAAHGGAAGRSEAEQHRTPSERFAQETMVPFALQGVRGIENNCHKRLFGSMNKRIPM